MKDLSLPVVDLSPFLLPSTDEDKQRCAAAVHRACLNFGFLYLTGFESVLPEAELHAPLDVSRTFFQRPAEEKAKIRIQQPDGARGYQVLGENVTLYKADHHEGLDLYKPVEQEDPVKPLHGPNLWPEHPAEFRPTMEAWVLKMQVIGLALMEATAMGLGIDLAGEEWETLKESVRDSFWVMRSIAYPPLPGTAPGISCGEHKDYGCWTLLYAFGCIGALQVFLKDPDGTEERSGLRGTWIDADPRPASFVINIGEMWEIWTNGIYRATLHRVIHKGKNLRISLPFFFEPAFDAVVAPLPSALALQATLPDQEVSLAALKKPAVYGEFLYSKVSANFVSKV